MKTVDYFMSVMSPWSYLGSRRFEAMVAEAGARVNIRPFNGGEVFANSGGVPLPKRHPSRQAYRLVELTRWKQELQLDAMIIQPQNFPASDQNAARLITATKQAGGDAVALAHHIMAGLWERDLTTSQAETLIDLANELGLDGVVLMAKAEDAAVLAEIDDNTKTAIDTGVFGMPWYVIDGTPFWGQDRLKFVAEALAG
jgi:2-hydroxychromene-2-carboxylate isomerase